VTFSAGSLSLVTIVTVILLPSGTGSTGKPVTLLLLSSGDCPLKNTVPSGAVTETKIWTTLVILFGMDTSTRMGVTPVANGTMIDASVAVKSTPGCPGLRSVGNDDGLRSVMIGLLIYCGLPMPSVSGQIVVVVIGVIVVVD